MGDFLLERSGHAAALLVKSKQVDHSFAEARRVKAVIELKFEKLES